MKPDLPTMWRAGSHLYISFAIDESKEIAAEHGREAEQLYRAMAEQKPGDKMAQRRWQLSQRMIERVKRHTDGDDGELAGEKVPDGRDGANEGDGPAECEPMVREDEANAGECSSSSSQRLVLTGD